MAPADQQRIADLERQVRILSAGLKLDEPLFELPPDVLRELDAGHYVTAVKQLRKRSAGSLSLVSAKKMLDEHQRTRPGAAPPAT